MARTIPWNLGNTTQFQKWITDPNRGPNVRTFDFTNLYGSEPVRCSPAFAAPRQRKMLQERRSNRKPRGRKGGKSGGGGRYRRYNKRDYEGTQDEDRAVVGLYPVVAAEAIAHVAKELSHLR